MQIHLTTPLLFTTLGGGKLSLLPVVMLGLPTSNTDALAEFIKPQGKRIELNDATTDKVQAYMRQHQTEALSEDGTTAYTVMGTALVECLPDPANRVFEATEEDNEHLDY